MDGIIVRPIITEQSINAASKGKFTFEVVKSADKGRIKKEVEKAFNVTVVSIATNIRKGKKKRYGMLKREVKISPLKKAVVTLKKGQKIDLFVSHE